MEKWKKHRPIQARKLEEVYPIEYKKEKITLGVDLSGIVGPALMQKVHRKGCQKSLRFCLALMGSLLLSIMILLLDL